MLLPVFIEILPGIRKQGAPLAPKPLQFPEHGKFLLSSGVPPFLFYLCTGGMAVFFNHLIYGEKFFPVYACLKILRKKKHLPHPDPQVLFPVCKDLKYHIPGIRKQGKKEKIKVLKLIFLLCLPGDKFRLLPAGKNHSGSFWTGQRKGKFPQILKFLHMPGIHAAGGT